MCLAAARLGVSEQDLVDIFNLPELGPPVPSLPVEAYLPPLQPTNASNSSSNASSSESSRAHSSSSKQRERTLFSEVFSSSQSLSEEKEPHEQQKVNDVDMNSSQSLPEEKEVHHEEQGNNVEMSSPSQSSSSSAPTSPLHAAILAFLRSKTTPKEKACDWKLSNLAPDLPEICLVNYIRWLTVVHRTNMEHYLASSSTLLFGDIRDLDNIDTVLNVPRWNALFADQPHVPPYISRVADLLAFYVRLLDCVESVVVDGASVVLAYHLRSRKYGKSICGVVLDLFRHAVLDKNDNDALILRSVPVENCIRILSFFLVHEVSPFTCPRLMNDATKKSLCLSVFGTDKITLPMFISLAVAYVSRLEIGQAQRCRISLAKLIQVWVIRNTCGFSEDNELIFSFWKLNKLSLKQAVEDIQQLEGDQFWEIGVKPLLDMRHERLESKASRIQFMFIVSLFKTMVYGKGLAIQVANYDAVSDLVLRLFSNIAKDPFVFFARVTSESEYHPNFFTTLNFLRSYVSSRAMQIRLLQKDGSFTESFLQHTELILQQTAKLVSIGTGFEKAIYLAQRGPLGRRSEGVYDSKIVQVAADKTKAVYHGRGQHSSAVSETDEKAWYQTVRFVTWLISSMDRFAKTKSPRASSSSDNIWVVFKTRQFCTIKNMCQFWISLLRLSLAMDKKPEVVQKTSEVGAWEISPTQKKGFDTVVEAVRKEMVSSKKFRSLTQDDVARLAATRRSTSNSLARSASLKRSNSKGESKSGTTKAFPKRPVLRSRAPEK